MATTRVPITAYIPPNIREASTFLAQVEHRSLSALVESALRAYVASEAAEEARCAERNRLDSMDAFGALSSEERERLVALGGRPRPTAVELERESVFAAPPTR